MEDNSHGTPTFAPHLLKIKLNSTNPAKVPWTIMKIKMIQSILLNLVFFSSYLRN